MIEQLVATLPPELVAWALADFERFRLVGILAAAAVLCLQVAAAAYVVRWVRG